MVVSSRPNSFRAVNATLVSIMRDAYSAGDRILRADEIVGGPGWVNTDRFDITAKPSTEVPRDQIRRMVQTLLEDRFGLIVNREDRKGDTYVLRPAYNDGRLGTGLRRAANDCDVNRPPAGSPSRLPNPSNGARPSLAAACQPIATLIAMLQGTLKTTVTDQTGLSGRWDFVLAHSTLQPSAASASPDNRPALPTALREQLGLRLDREKGLVKVLVIKSVQQPTAN